MAEHGLGHPPRLPRHPFATREGEGVPQPPGLFLSAQPIFDLRHPNTVHCAEVFGQIAGLDGPHKEHLLGTWEQHANPAHMRAFDQAVVAELAAVLARRPSNPKGPQSYAANLSMVTLQSREAVDEIVEIVKKSRINPARLGFEITETGPLHNGHAKTFRHNLETLKAAGHKLLADDVPMGPDFAIRFGIMQPYLDVIKLDKSVVTPLLAGEAAGTINPALPGVLATARKEGILLLAEGLETGHDIAKAHHLHLDLGQGYALGEPRRLTRENEMVSAPALPGL